MIRPWPPSVFVTLTFAALETPHAAAMAPIGDWVNVWRIRQQLAAAPSSNSSSLSLHSRVPLPAVGRVPVLRRAYGAVGVPRTSIHGHRCSQRTGPVGHIPRHQVKAPPLRVEAPPSTLVFTRVLTAGGPGMRLWRPLDVSEFKHYSVDFL